MIRKNRGTFGSVAVAGMVMAMLVFFTGCRSEAESYGAPIDAGTVKSVTLAALFSNPAGFEGKRVIVEGKSGQICQASGCWLMLTDDTHSLFVQFYNFTARPSRGTKVRVQGVFKTQNKVPFLAGEGLVLIRG